MNAWTELEGPWDEAYAASKYFLLEKELGLDIYGSMRNTHIRSQMGRWLRDFKYFGCYENVYKIINDMAPSIETWDVMNRIDIIMSVPPSKERKSYQPVHELVEQLAEKYKIIYTHDALTKTNVEELKHKPYEVKLEAIKGSIKLKRKSIRPYSALLVDDIWSSGITIRECARVLKSDTYLKKLYVLVVTKTDDYK